jgi:RimJ/RimL family protein N-acetyltransferase
LIGIVLFGRPDRTWYTIPGLDEPYISLDAEIGYAFGKAYWGKGYATEACQAVIEYVFKELRIKRIVTGIDPENTRSNNLQKRLGAKSWRGTCLWILENNML